MRPSTMAYLGSLLKASQSLLDHFCFLSGNLEDMGSVLGFVPQVSFVYVVYALVVLARIQFSKAPDPQQLAIRDYITQVGESWRKSLAISHTCRRMFVSFKIFYHWQKRGEQSGRLETEPSLDTFNVDGKRLEDNDNPLGLLSDVAMDSPGQATHQTASDFDIQQMYHLLFSGNT